MFVPPWVPPPAQLQALPWGPLDLSGLVGTDERDRWKSASYLTHTLAEQLSRWASLKPWGRPEGTMQRWHLHHRQHFTVYPSGWGNWSFTFHMLLGLPLVSTGDECVCFFGLVWCKMTLMSASGVSKKHVILQSFFCFIPSSLEGIQTFIAFLSSTLSDVCVEHFFTEVIIFHKQSLS